MKFKFKRKYTSAFLLFIILVLICVTFYFIGPHFIDKSESFFNQVLIISLLDSFLIVIFLLGLYRVNYYLYHNHMEIHRSLRKTIIIDYSTITDFIEYPNDKIFLLFGKRPSLKMRYQMHGKSKKQRIRIENHNLFKLILENEKKIAVHKNK